MTPNSQHVFHVRQFVTQTQFCRSPSRVSSYHVLVTHQCRCITIYIPKQECVESINVCFVENLSRTQVIAVQCLASRSSFMLAKSTQCLQIFNNNNHTFDSTHFGAHWPTDSRLTVNNCKYIHAQLTEITKRPSIERPYIKLFNKQNSKCCAVLCCDVITLKMILKLF